MHFTLIESIVRSHLGKTFPAAQVEVRVRGEAVYARAFGALDPEMRKQPTNLETCFDLASVSKLFTVSAFMTLVEAGSVALDQRVAEVLPEFSEARPIEPYPDPLRPGATVRVVEGEGQTVDAGQVTFRNLLAHNSGLPAWLPLWQLPDRGAMDHAALHSRFSYPTGARVIYSDIGLILLGFAVEKLAGKSLREAVHTRVTEPLGLATVRYSPVPCENVAPTEYYSRLGRRKCGEVHDENAWGFGGAAGHAGLFGTAHDVAALGEVFRTGGAPLLRAETVAEMTRLQAQDDSVRRGLGFALWSPDPDASSNPFSELAFGHTGFTGTCLWVDPARELVAASLTNRVYYGRENAAAISAFRVALHRAICRIVDDM